MRRGRGLGAGAAGRRSQPYIDERAAGAAHACPLSRGEMGPGEGGGAGNRPGPAFPWGVPAAPNLVTQGDAVLCGAVGTHG